MESTPNSISGTVFGGHVKVSQTQTSLKKFYVLNNLGYQEIKKVAATGFEPVTNVVFSM